MAIYNIEWKTGFKIVNEISGTFFKKIDDESHAFTTSENSSTMFKTKEEAETVIKKKKFSECQVKACKTLMMVEVLS